MKFFRPPKTIQTILTDGPLSKLQQRKHQGQQLQHLWQQAVTAEIAANSQCLAVRNGTLIVTVSSPAWAHRIQITKKHIIAYFEQFPDYAVERLSIRTDPTLFHKKSR